MIVVACVLHPLNTVDINTHEQLQKIARESDQLKIDAIWVICKAMEVNVKKLRFFAIFKKLVDSLQKRTEKTEEVSMIYL